METVLTPERQVECGGIRRGDRRIAYFSMEIGIASNIPTYSGGLGVLAGDTIKTFADLEIPAVAVTLLYRKGYFDQELDEHGRQRELPAHWEPERHLTPLPETILVTLRGRVVRVRAWEYVVRGLDGVCTSILFLDTNLPENSEHDRGLTDHLYGGDQEYRLAQEAVLGIGGVRMLKALGYTSISRYHMNEGHASLLALELLRERYNEGRGWDAEGVRELCVFTTHTPVPAGHDKFDYGLVGRVLDRFVPDDIFRRFGGEQDLNMTKLALNLSHYVNGVAEKHREVSREMFPGYDIQSITNGIHARTWVNKSFDELYARYVPGWRKDPFSLRYALSIPGGEIWDAHLRAKENLLRFIADTTGVSLERNVFTIGFARRATAYKRADLIFQDVDRLVDLTKHAGRVQLVFAGKAHPKDLPGKGMIEKIAAVSRRLEGTVSVVYLEDYDMDLALKLASGVDLWLNTPQKPQEASGTSGMKAALNGVPSLSILDGWWVEGCIEGLTGWGIGPVRGGQTNDEKDARSMYEKLEWSIIPMFYNRRDEWVAVMRHAIGINASFFNSHRMIQQYVLNAYFLGK